MTGQELLRKLIVRAPPDLVAAIYERLRPSRDSEGPSWPEIVRAAQGLGIFSADEARAFRQLLANRLGDAA